MIKPKKINYVVFYIDFPTMRERKFKTFKVASAFSEKVNGSFCAI